MAQLSKLLLLTSLLIFPSACTGDLGDENPDSGKQEDAITSTGTGSTAGTNTSTEPEPAPIVGCIAGTIDCGGECISAASDSANCGECGTVCGASESCQEGVCVLFCAQGETDCDGQCLVTASDTANCGSCGNQCADGEFCDAGKCSTECSGVECSDSNGGTECVHVAENTAHCGECGEACEANDSCEAGVCVKNCFLADQTLCNGECVIFGTDASNCGSCGTACDAGVACVEGACGSGTPVCTGGACSCTSVQSACNDTCVNTSTNALHCGECNNKCDTGKSCEGGSCTCEPGTNECSGSCVDFQDDRSNCGTCGTTCKTGQSCSSGVCECSGGKNLCGDSCVNVQTDENNCGTCGTSCTATETCESGSCVCATGETSCSNECVDTQDDANNCGTCGTKCTGSEACVEGQCQDADGCGGKAKKIDITRISMYQAVELDLFKGGQTVEPDSRKVPVIQGRKAMVRVFVQPKPGFSQRELSARVFVKEGNNLELFFKKKSVSGQSVQNNLGSTIQVEVPASAMGANKEYWVELVECGGSATGAAGIVRVPQTGTKVLSAQKTGPIKVVFVPLKHDNRTPNTSNAMMKKYAADVERMYPTTKVNFSVASVMPSGQSGTNINISNLLDTVTKRREDDSVATDVYYYGLINPANSFGEYCRGGCVMGVAWAPGEASWAARQRAGVGVSFGETGISTFSHELGHNHGRMHAPCQVAGGGNWPSGAAYQGGKIGVWGYDRDSKQLKNPASVTDFMGYCNDTWVSDYSYKGYFKRIRSVNGVPSPYVLETGELATWATMIVSDSGAYWSRPVEGRGEPGRNPENAQVYDESGDVVAEVSVYRVNMSEDLGYMLYVPMAQPGWYAVGLEGGPILTY